MKRSPEERAEAYLQKLRVQFEDPKIRRVWADRSARLRRLYLTLFLFLLSTAALTALAMSQSTLMVVLSSLAVVVFAIPQTAVFQVLEAGSRTSHGYEQVVDERQRAEVDAARNLGHSITSALLILVVAIAGAAQIAGTYPPASLTVPIGLFLPVTWVVLVLHRSFPAFYLAWSQPDETPDTENVPLT